MGEENAVEALRKQDYNQDRGIPITKSDEWKSLELNPLEFPNIVWIPPVKEGVTCVKDFQTEERDKFEYILQELDLPYEEELAHEFPESDIAIHNLTVFQNEGKKERYKEAYEDTYEELNDIVGLLKLGTEKTMDRDLREEFFELSEQYFKDTQGINSCEAKVKAINEYIKGMKGNIKDPEDLLLYFQENEDGKVTTIEMFPFLSEIEDREKGEIKEKIGSGIYTGNIPCSIDCKYNRRRGEKMKEIYERWMPDKMEEIREINMERIYDQARGIKEALKN